MRQPCSPSSSSSSRLRWSKRAISSVAFEQPEHRLRQALRDDGVPEGRGMDSVRDELRVVRSDGPPQVQIAALRVLVESIAESHGQDVLASTLVSREEWMR